MVKKRIKRVVKKKFNFKNEIIKNYKESFHFLAESKNFILFAITFFLIAIFIGFIYPYFGQELLKKWIEELLKETAGFGFWRFFWFIFQNNALVSLTAIIFGFFFSIFPVFTLLFNGYVIGIVMRASVDSSSLLELWRLVPHGIFELPAVLISIALGIRFGIDLMINCLLFYKKKLPKIPLSIYVIICLLFFPITFLIILILTIQNNDLRSKLSFNFVNSINVFIFIIIPLLLVAALIEASLIVLMK
ncbi:MAG: stage II sporulation protein M [Nanoarchaeota archaeon]